MATQNNFYGPHTEKKLQAIGAYLQSFLTVLSKQNFETIYIDAFAGSGTFLDPTGNHVGWSTLDALAATEHVDLWYLFPAGLGVNRQISNVDAKMTTEQKASLDRLFGPNEWQDKFIRKTIQEDLFGKVETTSKVASIDDITRYKIDCMKKIFKGEVLDKWLPLGRDGAHWYSLIFAMANPSRKAKVIGHDIARHIMTNS